MQQPKIRAAFAIAVILVIGIFFTALIVISGKVQDLGNKVIEKSARQSGLQDKDMRSDDKKGVACTQEAKLCPDGKTFVGRTGPKCEFAACPGVSAANSSIDTSDWKTYRNDEYGFEFKYPKEWSKDEERSSDDEMVFNLAKNNAPESREAIAFRKNAEKLNVSQAAEKIVKEHDISLETIDKSFSLTVAGEKAIKINTGEFAQEIIVFVHNDVVYIVTTQGVILDKNVLSTFRFIR